MEFNTKNKNKRIILFVICIIFFTFIITVLLSAFTLASLYYKSVSVFQNNIIFKIYSSDSQKTISYNSKESLVYRDNVPYVNFNLISDVCNFSIIGDSSTQRILLRNDREDSIVFDVGTSFVTINNVNITMNGISIYTSDKILLIPLDFLNNYFNGITVSEDSNNDRIIHIKCDTAGDIYMTIRRDVECVPVK